MLPGSKLTIKSIFRKPYQVNLTIPWLDDPYHKVDALYYDNEPIATNHQRGPQVPLGASI